MKKGIVTYDLSNTRQRTKLYKILSAYGKRIQFSVFEYELNEKLYNEMKRGISKIYNESMFIKRVNPKFAEDRVSIIIFDLCDGCKSKTYYFNKNEKIKEERYVF